MNMACLHSQIICNAECECRAIIIIVITEIKTDRNNVAEKFNNRYMLYGDLILNPIVTLIKLRFRFLRESFCVGYTTDFTTIYRITKNECI